MMSGTHERQRLRRTVPRRLHLHRPTPIPAVWFAVRQVRPDLQLETPRREMGGTPSGATAPPVTR